MLRDETDIYTTISGNKHIIFVIKRFFDLPYVFYFVSKTFDSYSYIIERNINEFV